MRGNQIYRLLWLLLMGIYTITAHTQPRLRETEMYIGVHGGMLASTMIWQPNVSGTALHFSGNGGAVFRYNNTKYCGVQVELNYMQRGWHEKINSTTGTDNGVYFRRLDYLELPFLMHIYFGNQYWRGFLNAGPQAGYCLHDLSSGPRNLTDTAQYGAVYYPFDWGIAAGLGLYYRSYKAGVFQLEARFNYSLSDLFDHRQTAYFNQSHAMNISVNIGYLWEIKRKRKEQP